MKLAIVTPVFNEEAVIGAFYERLSSVLTHMSGIVCRIVFVVDRSTDRTVDILRSIAERDSRVTVLCLSARFGHQMSLLAGIEHALDGDAIVMLDSDLQHPPELIPVLLDRFRQGFDIIATRRRRNDDAGWLRRQFGALFYKTLAAISQTPIHPDSADFRLISRRAAHALCSGFTERNLFLRGAFAWLGFRQTSVDFDAPARFAGQSKYSLSRMLKLALTGVLSSSARPLYLGVVLGLLFAGVAFLLILWTLASYFIRAVTPSGWTTMMVLMLFFSGVQLLSIGIVGMYIGGIYEEVKARPRYLVDEIIGSTAIADSPPLPNRTHES